jgi:hypothetical protein
MLGNTKSNSKKVFVTNNSKTKPRPSGNTGTSGNQSTDTGAIFMRRYKSQENYLVSGKKFKTNSSSNGVNNANNLNNITNSTNINNANQSQATTTNLLNTTIQNQSQTPATNLINSNNANHSNLNSPNYKDANNLIFSKSKELNTVNIQSTSNGNATNSNLRKTLSSSSTNKKKNLSPESNKIQSKMTAYIHSKPKNTNKLAAVSKIMNDESIQELNTEENSKNFLKFFKYFYFLPPNIS